MLRTNCPIRAVEEEQQERFKNVRPYTVPATTFARTADRALRACFALSTDHSQVVYVKCLTGKTDVYYDKRRSTLEIRHRWLKYASTPHQSFCRSWSPSSLADINAPFFCCQVVEELLIRSIDSVFKAHLTSRPAEINFMRQTGRRLRYLPHSVNLKPYPGVLWSAGKRMRRKHFPRSALAAQTIMLCCAKAIAPVSRRRFSTRKQVSGHRLYKKIKNLPSSPPHRSGVSLPSSAIRSSDTPNMPL